MFLCVPPGPTQYIFHTPTARYSLFLLNVSSNTNKPNKPTLEREMSTAPAYALLVEYGKLYILIYLPNILIRSAEADHHDSSQSHHMNMTISK